MPTDKKKPIIVNDKNDPRLKAYNDSLNLFNSSEKAKKWFAKQNPNGDNVYSGLAWDKFILDDVRSDKNLNKSYDSLSKLNKKEPVGPLTKFRISAVMNGKDYYKDTTETYFPNFKKPVQPVIFQKLEPIKPLGIKPMETSVEAKLAGDTSVTQSNYNKPLYQDFVKTANQDYLGPDYNLEEAYKNLPYNMMQAWAKDPENNHLPDTYKLPNHPTFSNESIYYKPGMKAVKWVGDNPVNIENQNYTGSKALKIQGKPTGYVNIGDGTGRKEIKRNGGWLDSLDNNKFQEGGEFGDYKQAGPVEDSQSEYVGRAGMTGMMKSKIATEANYGNPSALRMVSPNPKTGMTPEGVGTHYMRSVDNYAVPELQDKGGKNLELIKNPPISNEDIRFNSPEEADYFAKNYKDVAPMMRGTAPDVTNATEYIKNWYNSPMYGNILRNQIADSGVKNPKRIERVAKRSIKFANKEVNSPFYNVTPDIVDDPEYHGRSIDDHKGGRKINLNRNFVKNNPKLVNSLFAHELAHDNLMTSKDIEYVNQKTMYSGTTPGPDPGDISKYWYNIITDPGEVRSQIHSIRQLSKENQIYDPFTEPFKKEYLDKVNESYKQGTGTEKYENYNQLKRLRQIYSDNQITEMMNTISKSNSNDGKVYAKNGGWLDGLTTNNVIEDNRGQWAHPGKVTKINSNQITMRGVNYPVLGVSDSGDTQMMQPGKEYNFKGKTVTEYPQKFQNGGFKGIPSNIPSNATSAMKALMPAIQKSNAQAANTNFNANLNYKTEPTAVSTTSVNNNVAQQKAAELAKDIKTYGTPEKAIIAKVAAKAMAEAKTNKNKGTIAKTQSINPNDRWMLGAANYRGDNPEQVINANKQAQAIGAMGAGVVGVGSIPVVSQTLGAGFAAKGVHDIPQTVRTVMDPNVSLHDKAKAVTFNAGDFLGLTEGVKGAKALGKFATEETALKNAYNILPEGVFKGYSKLKNPNKSYRVAGLDAAKDFQNTGVLRSNNTTPAQLVEGTNFMLPPRPTGFPSFQKGYADMAYAPKEGAVVFETDLPTFKRGEINPVTGQQIKGRHYAHRVIDPKTGTTMAEIPGENIKMFEGNPNWLKGYKQVIPKTTTASSSTESVISNSEKNLEDLLATKKFAEKFGYKLPENLERIAQSDELTNKTVRGIMNRHNTFVRGVSTNWAEIKKKNPEILRHLEGKGFDISTEEGSKKAAEYMGTHIPINTGYGRASLNNNVLDSGIEGLYTSNSIPTGEGYTYGNGFIVKGKKPTDFSSLNRKDWINNNQVDYHENYVPKVTQGGHYADNGNRMEDYAMYSNHPGGHEARIKDLIADGFTVKEIQNILKSNLHQYITEIKNAKTPAGFLPSHLEKNLREAEYKLAELKNSKWKSFEKRNPSVDKSILKTEHFKSHTYGEHFGKFGNVALDLIPKLEKNPQLVAGHNKNIIQLTTNVSKKYNPEITKLQEEYSALADKNPSKLTSVERAKMVDLRARNEALQAQSKQEVTKLHREYLDKNFKGWENESERYAHYIHLGVPGEKALDVISTKKITPEIWKNKSRAHTNTYSKGLSAAGITGITLGTGALAKDKKQNGGWLNNLSTNKFDMGGVLDGLDGVDKGTQVPDATATAKPVVDLNFAVTPAQKQLAAKNKRQAEIDMQVDHPEFYTNSNFLDKKAVKPYSVEDYKKYGIKEPGLQTSMDPIDLVGTGVYKGLAKALGAKEVAVAADAALFNSLDKSKVLYNQVKSKAKDEIYKLKYNKDIASLESKKFNAMQKMNNPEGWKRLREQGIEPKQFFDQLNKSKITSTRDIGSFDNGAQINIDFNQVKRLKKEGYDLSVDDIIDHEIGHRMQRGFNSKAVNDYNQAKSYNYRNQVPKQFMYSTPLDKEAELLLSPVIKNPNGNSDYFLFGSDNKERLPFLREAKESMVSKGFINNIYSKITPETVKKFLKEVPSNRFSTFLDVENPITHRRLSGLLNKTPIVAGAGLGVNELAKDKKQNTGWLDNLK